MLAHHFFSVDMSDYGYFTNYGGVGAGGIPSQPDYTAALARIQGMPNDQLQQLMDDNNKCEDLIRSLEQVYYLPYIIIIIYFSLLLSVQNTFMTRSSLTTSKNKNNVRNINSIVIETKT